MDETPSFLHLIEFYRIQSDGTWKLDKVHISDEDLKKKLEV